MSVSQELGFHKDCVHFFPTSHAHADLRGMCGKGEEWAKKITSANLLPRGTEMFQTRRAILTLPQLNLNLDQKLGK